MAHDIVLIVIALWLSLFIRLDDFSQSLPNATYQMAYWVYSCTVFASLILFQAHRRVLRYSSWQLTRVILTACLAGTFVASFIFYVFDWLAPPRSSAFLFPFVATVLLYGSRVAMKSRHLGLAMINQLSSFKLSIDSSNSKAKVVAIYGAGEAGQQLFESLKQAPEYIPVVFIDDDPQLDNALIDNTPVVHSSRITSVINSYEIDEVLLAVPSATASQRQQIIDRIQRQQVISVRTLPTLNDIVMGKVNITHLKAFEISDVLGRQAIEPNHQLLSDAVKQKTIIITGAGGSIGSEICRQALSYRPSVLILLDNSEHNLYQIHRDCQKKLRGLEQDTQLIAKLISITEAPALLAILQQYQPQLCFHAAAYKHVPLVEENPQQAFFNNSIGTQICAQACIVAQVAKFVLISTDKAVRPTNIMGATKRIAELILQAYSQTTECPIDPVFNQQQSSFANNTQFSMVRFGNVLDSSGSVIPLFREQIQQGGPVTVTDKAITRYFMTIPEAAQLVIQSSQLSRGGDVLLLDMGEPIKINDLAKKLITLSGHSIRSAENPNGDIAIEYSGLRAGEKRYEELLIDSNNASITQHEKIWRANEQSLTLDQLIDFLNQISAAFAADNRQQVEQLLQRPEVGFNSQMP